MPKVSICIPTFNNIGAFKRCFESVLLQTYNDYEIIITDDSSNDDISMFLNHQQNLENIHYYKNQLSLGSPENWNEGIRKAKGEYIKILHHDDFFTYDYSLEIFVQLLESNPSCSLAFVGSRNFDVEKNEVINYNRPSLEKINQIKSDPLILLNGNFIGAPSATIFRKVPNLYFDKSLIWFVDIDFYIQILLKNNHLEYCDIDAITIGASTSQITKSVENDERIIVFEHFYILNKWSLNKLIGSPFEKSTYSLLKRFNIFNNQRIRTLGFSDLLPIDLNKLFLRIYLEKASAKFNKMIRTIRQIRYKL